MFDYGTLREIWWLLLGVLLIGFAISDGYDLGLGAIYRFIARDDTERRMALEAIEPHWEGHQVWFILGGGAVFAAWPMLYAASFSGFYFAMLLVLLALILRPVGFNFRNKVDNPRWRRVATPSRASTASAGASHSSGCARWLPSHAPAATATCLPSGLDGPSATMALAIVWPGSIASHAPAATNAARVASAATRATPRARSPTPPSIFIAANIAPCITSIARLTTPASSANGWNSARKLPS